MSARRPWTMVEDVSTRGPSGELVHRERTFEWREWTVFITEAKGSLDSVRLDDGESAVTLVPSQLGPAAYAIRDMVCEPTDWSS